MHPSYPLTLLGHVIWRIHVLWVAANGGTYYLADEALPTIVHTVC
jgi:hypothetical protein